MAYRKKGQKVSKKTGSYYPFGLKHKGYNNVTSSLGNSTAQKFGYNGKELEESLGLGWNDLGARRMDPALGRFITPDPLADFVNYQSPYAMAENNPILYVDTYGLGIFRTIGEFFKRLGNGIAGACGGKECRYDRFHKTSYKDTMKETDISNRVVDAVGGLIKKIGNIKINVNINNNNKGSSSNPPSNNGISSPTLPEPVFPSPNISLPALSPDIRIAKQPDRSFGTINDTEIQAGDNSFTNLISFGKGGLKKFKIMNGSTSIPQTNKNIGALNQIANILLKNPGSVIYLKLVVAKVRRKGDIKAVKKYNQERLDDFTKELRNRGVNNRVEFEPINLRSIMHNNNIINVNVPER